MYRERVRQAGAAATRFVRKPEEPHASRFWQVSGCRFKPPDNHPLINVNNHRLPTQHSPSLLALDFYVVSSRSTVF